MIVTLTTITFAILIIIGGFFALDELENCYKQKKDEKMEVNDSGKNNNNDDKWFWIFAIVTIICAIIGSIFG